MTAPRASRRSALVAVMLLVPLLAATFALVAVPHGSHDCPLDKECVACRWAAHGAVEVTAPASLPVLLTPVGKTPAATVARAADGSSITSTSRGPPSADA